MTVVCVFYCPPFFAVQREEQVVKLLNSDKSAECNSCGQGARRGDLLEIEYTAKLEDGKVFDGSSIKVSTNATGLRSPLAARPHGRRSHCFALASTFCSPRL